MARRNSNSQHIVYESGDYFVVRAPRGKGFEIYKNDVTASVRVSQVGYEGQRGLDWTKSEIERRQLVDAGKKNPIFLPKIFDRYIVKTSDGKITVDRIQTLGGAEKKALELLKKYPCVGASIISEKHGTVVKEYKAAMGKSPKVETDNTREYAKEAKADEKFVLYVDGQEFATYDTKKEAEQVGRKEGGRWRVKRQTANPYKGFAGGTLESGDAAFYDTFAGTIPCKVLSITGRSGNPGSAQTITVKLTASRGAYKKGEVIESNGLKIVPRAAVHGNRIRSNYRVIVDGDNASHSANPARQLDLFTMMLSKFGFHMVESDTHNGTVYEGPGPVDAPQILVKNHLPGKLHPWFYTHGSYKRSGDGMNELERFIDGRFPKSLGKAGRSVSNPSTKYVFKIDGLPKDTAYNAMPFGRQIEYRHAIEAFKASAQKTWVSSKRKSTASALAEFKRLYKPTQYFFVNHDGPGYHDDSFEVWYKTADEPNPTHRASATYTIIGDDRQGNRSKVEVNAITAGNASREAKRLHPRKFVTNVQVLRSRKQNPETSSDLYETFHGKPSTKETIYESEEFEREHFAQLGPLVELKVATESGKEVVLTAPTPDESDIDRVVQLASSPDGKQLFLIGGEQTVDVKAFGLTNKDVRDHMVLGTLTELTYQTEKGFDKFKKIQYFHKLGEETGVCPILLYNPQNESLSIAGGQYEVRDVGICN